MRSFTVRNIDDQVHAAIKARAAQCGMQLETYCRALIEKDARTAASRLPVLIALYRAAKLVSSSMGIIQANPFPAIHLTMPDATDIDEAERQWLDGAPAAAIKSLCDSGYLSASHAALISVYFEGPCFDTAGCLSLIERFILADDAVGR